MRGYTNTTETFWQRVDKTPTCWLWTGGKDWRGGYGRFTSKYFKTIRPHRIAYELLVGPIPKGLQLDHLCRVRHCVNPAHLEPVTLKENVLRGTGISATNARKTHCKRGHKLEGANVYRYWKGRMCLVCRNLRRERMRAMGIKRNI